MSASSTRTLLRRIAALSLFMALVWATTVIIGIPTAKLMQADKVRARVVAQMNVESYCRVRSCDPTRYVVRDSPDVQEGLLYKTYQFRFLSLDNMGTHLLVLVAYRTYDTSIDVIKIDGADVKRDFSAM